MNLLLVIVKDFGIFMFYFNIILLVYVFFCNEFVLSFLVVDVLVIVCEDIVEGSFIYCVNVSDVDFGLDGEIRYSIIGGNDGLMFFINFIIGEIIIFEILDCEL